MSPSRLDQLRRPLRPALVGCGEWYRVGLRSARSERRRQLSIRYILYSRCVPPNPKEDVEHHGWKTGQRFAVQLTPLEERPVLRQELREALEESWERNSEGYQYLANR